MVEILDFVVAALGSGAAIASKEVLQEGAKDAYEGLRNALKRNKIPDSDLVKLEEKPDSLARQAVIKELLEENNAASDDQLQYFAKLLRDELMKVDIATVKAFKLDIDDAEIQGSVLVEDVKASGGAVDISSKGTKVVGDFTVKGVEVDAGGGSKN